MLTPKRLRTFLSALVILCPAISHGQADQVLVDYYGATTDEIFAIDFDTGSLLGPQNPGDGARNFEAIAFEAPNLGSLDASRNLIAVDGTAILRYYNSTNDPTENAGGDNPELLFDAADSPSGLRFVNTVAVATDGTVIFSGYSRRKRRFELWAIDPDPATPDPREFIVGTPQLSDAAYIDSEDIVDPTHPLASGGLLAAADGQVLFFPAAENHEAFSTLADVRDLPVKNNTDILSVDFARETMHLVLALSTRELMTLDLVSGSVNFSAIPDLGMPDPRCADSRSQHLRVRNAGLEVGPGGQSLAVTALADACGQVLAHAFDPDAPGTDGYTALVAPSESLTALAVGEGNQVVCQSGVTCTLTSGYEADIDTDNDSVLLVLKVNGLCDPRVPVAATVAESCYDPTYGDNYATAYPFAAIDSGDLVLNDLLPNALREALAGDPTDATDDVVIVIPSYMSAAAPNAQFGAVFVQADEFSRDALVAARLELGDLLSFAGLGVATGEPRGTEILSLLNNDVVAYAPDNSAFPTIRGFEATPSTIGEGSVRILKRGYSADIYGLQHDVTAASLRGENGGISILNPAGISPACSLVLGGLVYTPSANPSDYFLNLVACLFADMESLLSDTTLIPDDATDPFDYALTSTDRSALINRLLNTKDKLIKALNADGPNEGETNFQSVVSQLNEFDALLESTAFADAWKIYKNDLIVRSQVFRFNLLERADPSIEP